LDDLWLFFIGKPVRVTGKGSAGMGAGTASNTRGLPMPFTMQRAHVTLCTSHSTWGSDPLFAIIHFLATAVTAGTSITNNLWHFRLPQNKYQVPCLLLFICICSSWHAGTHKQGLLPKPQKSL